MYLTKSSKSHYLKTIVILLSVFVSLSSVSANAAKKHSHRHKHNTVVIHEVYVFNPRPVFTPDGKIIRNNIVFNPHPIITTPVAITPTAPVTPLPSCGTTNSAPAAAPNQSVQFNIHN